MRRKRLIWVMVIVAFSGVVLAGAGMAFRKSDLYTIFVYSGPGGLTVPQNPIALTGDLQARIASLEPIRGERVVAAAFDERPTLVVFFASWCPPCAREFDELAAFLDAEGPGSINVIAINWRESSHGGYSEPRMRRMLQRVHDDIAVVAGTDEVGRLFDDVHSVPAVFIFHRDTEVARLGGDPGPDGLHYLTRKELGRSLKALEQQ